MKKRVCFMVEMSTYERAQRFKGKVNYNELLKEKYEEMVSQLELVEKILGRLK